VRAFIRELIPDWRPSREQLLWTARGVIGLVVILGILTLIGLPFDITLWDWLELLIVPAVLALGGYLFTRSENLRTQKIADQQRTSDREIADERRQDDMLQAYLDGMLQLLTDEERPLLRARPGDNLSAVVRARTLTVLSRLDGGRRGSVLRFLYESGLIYKDSPVFRLDGANLRGAVLTKTNLHAAALSGSDLRGADLSWALLNEANLANASSEGANLEGAGMYKADLLGTKLHRANLEGVQGITDEQLAECHILVGAIMPDGQKYEDWLKTKDRAAGEDGDNSDPS
jgi:hypothetical protein